MTARKTQESTARPRSAVVIRSIRPADAAGLQAFHARLSNDTIRNRFLGVHRVLRDTEAHGFTSVLRGKDAALVATVDEVIVAVGRYVGLSGADAEVAFVVEDPYQGHGIATALLTLLAHSAWDDGIRRLVADTFATNRAMLDVFMHTPRAVTVLEHATGRVGRPRCHGRGAAEQPAGHGGRGSAPRATLPCKGRRRQCRVSR